MNEISQGSLPPSMAQLLQDHISLQSQQQGLTGVSLKIRRPAMKLLRLVQGPLTG